MYGDGKLTRSCYGRRTNVTRRQRAMQIANLEGYHISFLLLVTTSQTPSVTKSNYRDTNPGLN